MYENSTSLSEHLRWCIRGRAESAAEMAVRGRLRPVDSAHHLPELRLRLQGADDG